jgi:hypothetical protein
VAGRCDAHPGYDGLDPEQVDPGLQLAPFLPVLLPDEFCRGRDLPTRQYDVLATLFPKKMPVHAHSQARPSGASYVPHVVAGQVRGRSKLVGER